ncbi:MAG TPA: DNA-formamidopyrimidine glycosylase family protein, partial [Actinomycetota bacterium]|nr:DNA-formamidopyrimidine glycosylase family protein [Actinomycetota bacterium]
MPEMPEMQALAERLAEEVVGKRLVRMIPLQFSAAKTFDPPPEAIVGRTLAEVGRRGKYLVLDFGENRMLIHLSQGGRVDVEIPAKTTRAKNGVVRLVFEHGTGILVKEFGTQRKAGWWLLRSGDDGPLASLGPEPFDPGFERWALEGSDRRRLHTALRDQRTVAGIGRGYVDEILHELRVSPYSTLDRLDAGQRKALVVAARTILERGLVLERDRT